MVLDPVSAELRIDCPHAETCGGCPGIGLTYGEQLTLKRGRVVRALMRFPALELHYTEPVEPAPEVLGYRTRAKLIVARGGKVGLFARGGGHKVVDIPGCRVLAPSLVALTEALREVCRSGALPTSDEGGKGLRAVDLREVRDAQGRARVLVTLVVEGVAADDPRLRAVAEGLVAGDLPVAGVAASVHAGDSPQVLGTETVHLAGDAMALDHVARVAHLATFGSFVQAHRDQAARVHAWLVRALATPREGSKPPERAPTLLDLYGGSGAMALALAAAGADVTLVESFGPAARLAEQAAARAGLRLRAEHADAATALRRFVERGTKFDGVVVNPPRRGASALVREQLARLAPEIVAYVSCDPDTLARDLEHFARLGWATYQLRPLDMIPLTEEVETFVVLRRAPVPTPRVLWEDDEALIVEKGAHEPTTPQGEYLGSLFARVRKLPGCADAVPVHRHDVGTSGLVLFVKRAGTAPTWATALTAETARKVYLAAVRGVAPSKGAVSRALREGQAVHEARTRYRRLAVFGGHSLLRVVPEQGRTHQIRRHLASVGHPVLGDARYGHAPSNRFFEEKHTLDRTFLHCVRLELDHPTTGARIVVDAEVPGDLRTVLERASPPGTLRFLEHKNALGRPSSLPPAPRSSAPGSALELAEGAPSSRDELSGDDEPMPGPRPSDV